MLAKARDIHGEHVHARLALRDPLRDGQPDAAALAEARHHAASEEVIAEAAHRADDRVAVGREHHAAIDDALDPAIGKTRVALHRHFERAPDPVDIVGQQLVREILRRAADRPMLAAMLVGADQQTLAFLPQIGFAIEIDAHGDFAIEPRHRRNVVGDDVLVLHRHDRQLDARHPPHLARPQPAGIDDIIGLDGAVLGDDQPAAIRGLLQLDHGIAQIDLGAPRLGGLGIGVGDAGGIDMPVIGIVERTDETRRVDQGIEFLHLLHRHEIEIELQVARPAALHPEIIHAGLAGREIEEADAVDAADLARFLFQLVIEPHRISLQRGHVGVAIDGVHAAGGMPGRAGGQLRALDQGNVGPTELRQVIEHTDAHHAAADHRHAHMRFHGNWSLGNLESSADSAKRTDPLQRAKWSESS